MTVAAVILADTAESALEDADGQPRVRRIVDAAWSGGAIPIVVVAPDPDGRVAATLAAAPVTLAEPARQPADAAGLGSPAAQIARGIDVATAEVSETDAVVVWPVRFAWTGPETITSLIEASGVESSRSAIVRPAFDGTSGWPVIVPIACRGALDALGAARTPDEILAGLADGGVIVVDIDLGDPGTVLDTATARADLPAYVGPAEPASGRAHEWGAAIADEPDDAPLPGPAIATLADDEG